MLLTCLLSTSDSVEHVPLEVKLNLGDKDSRCADCNTCIKSKISCTSAHNLDNGAAVMGSRCVTDSVNHLHDCVKTCVIAYCIIAASDIIVDRAGNTYAGNSTLGKVSCTSE